MEDKIINSGRIMWEVPKGSRTYELDKVCSVGVYSEELEEGNYDIIAKNMDNLSDLLVLMNVNKNDINDKIDEILSFNEQYDIFIRQWSQLTNEKR
jgi:hypothetical protein